MNFTELDRYMESLYACGFPAYELAVTKDGKTVYRKSFGYSDYGKTKPASSKDLYWIYSCSKTTTTAAAMKCVEMGLFRTTDLVSKYLPEFGKMKYLDEDGNVKDCPDEMTIEHLFLMTAGLDYDRNTPAFQEIKKNPEATTREVVRIIPEKPLMFRPGTRYNYSLAHDVLGAVIEVASGRKLSDFLKTYFWEPLGMHDTGFHPDEEQKKRFSAFYRYRNGSGEAIEWPVDYSYQVTPAYESGGAGLFSSADDQIRMMTMMACDGKAPDGREIMKKETILQMTVNRISGNPLNGFAVNRNFGYGFGYGLRVHYDPVRSRSLSPAGEFGWDGASGGFTMIDPFNHVACYFALHMLNCYYSYYQVHPTLRNLIYKGLNKK